MHCFHHCGPDVIPDLGIEIPTSSCCMPQVKPPTPNQQQTKQKHPKGISMPTDSKLKRVKTFMTLQWTREGSPKRVQRCMQSSQDPEPLPKGAKRKDSLFSSDSWEQLVGRWLQRGAAYISTQPYSQGSHPIVGLLNRQELIVTLWQEESHAKLPRTQIETNRKARSITSGPPKSNLTSVTIQRIPYGKMFSF